MKRLLIVRSTATLLIAGVFLVVGCSKPELTEDRIANYVKTYQNLAGAGSQLKAKLGGAQDGSSCDACQPLLEASATKAGYEDYDAFLKDDERIRTAVTFIQLKSTFSKAQEGMGKMTDEKTCMQMMGAQGDLSEEEKKEKCKTMASGMGAAQGAMSAVGSVMEFFVDEEDVEALRPHIGKIDPVINNKALPCEFDFTCKEKNLDLMKAGKM